MMKRSTILFILLTLLAACQEDGSGWKDTDLLEYGIPLTISAPDSVEVKAMDLASIQDVTVRGADYNLQILASDASTADVSEVKARELQAVRELPFFARVVEEKEDGFVYELQIDSTTASYGFRFIALRGDREFVFQPGLSAMYSLEEAQRLYQAVQPE